MRICYKNVSEVVGLWGGAVINLRGHLHVLLLWIIDYLIYTGGLTAAEYLSVREYKELLELKLLEFKLLTTCQQKGETALLMS